MPAPIKSEQLVVNTPLKPLRDDLDLTIVKTKETSDGLMVLLESQNKLAKSAEDSAKGFKKVTDAEAAQIKLLQEKIKVDQQLNKLEADKIKLDKLDEQARKAKIQRQQSELRLSVQQQKEQERLNKQSAKTAAQKKKENSAFTQLNAKIREQSLRYKDLLVEEGKETRATRRLRKEILSLNKIRDRANESLGQHQAKVGQYTKVVSKLRSGLTQLGIGFGVFQLLRNTLGIITNFDTALTDLGAISGKTEQQLEPLKEQALELGATTQFTASEITALQIELAKLGFEMGDISAATGPISQFATATGAAIPEAAALAGSALRAFQLDASEMERVVSVLGVATTKTGLDFGFLEAAMSTVAPVAAAFGFSIEDTTALLGQLANSGFDASSAATATRNILLNLADANGELAQALGRPVTSADELAGALTELQEKGIDLGAALELTDKRSVAAFETFLKGSDSLVDLRDSITDVSDELEQMSEKRLDSIAGATDLLRSAWEGLVLEWNEGEGVGESLKNVILFLAKNLRTVIKVVLGGLRAWALQKIAVQLFRMEVDKTGKTITLGLIPSLIKSGKAIIGAGKAFKIGAISARGFGTALKSIPFVGIISGLISIIGLFSDMGEETEEAEVKLTAFGESQKKINEQVSDENRELAILFESLRRTNFEQEERKQLIDEINNRYGTTLQNLADESAFVDQITVSYHALANAIKIKARQEEAQANLLPLLEERNQLQDELSRVKPRAFEGLGPDDDPFESEFVRSESRRIKNRIREIEDLIALATQVDETTTTSSKKRSKDPKTESELARQRFKDLQRVNKQNLIAVEKTLRSHEATKEEIREGVRKANIRNLKIEADFALKNFGEFSDEFIKANVDLSKAIESIDKDQKDNKKQRFDDLVAQNKENLKLIELELINNGAKREDIEKALADERIENLKKELDLALELFGENSEEVLGIKLALNKALLNADENAATQRLKQEKELYKTIRDEIATTSELLANMHKQRLGEVDLQIKKEQDRFDQSRTREDELRAFAKENNLDASESIAAEREIQKKAELERQKLERKRVQVEALIASLQAFGAKVQQGEGNPVTNIKNDINNIKGFVEGAFVSGTETTLGDALGYTGKTDAHLILGDEREAIFNPKQTSDLGIGKGGNTTQDIVDWYKYSSYNNLLAHATSIDSTPKPVVIPAYDNELKEILNQVAQNTQPSKQPQGKTTFNTITGVLEYQYKTATRKGRIKYPVRKR